MRLLHGEFPQNVPTYLLAERYSSVGSFMCCSLNEVVFSLEEIQTMGIENEVHKVPV